MLAGRENWKQLPPKKKRSPLGYAKVEQNRFLTVAPFKAELLK
jgi:hypothetical protein